VSGPLIILTGAIYAWIAVDQAIKGNPGMATAYAGYAFANAGLWMLAK
jgi:hypothetical protein